MAARRPPGRRKDARRSRRREPWWTDIPYRELLEVRLCDLDLKIEGTALEQRVEHLYEELDRVGLRFRPHVWLSSDWFTPDGVPGLAIPFFLAHPRLARIEHRMMFELEGGNHPWCMKLLRHETGHAIDNAYLLRRKKRCREAFGRFSVPYRSYYAPRPSSKSYVLNLDFWYAQSHPSEDFAETFAVWLQRGSHWRRRYAGWPALKKLQAVDEIMADVAQQPARVRSRARPDSMSRLRMTLREHYREKQNYYRAAPQTSFDRHLRMLFSDDPTQLHRDTAASFLRRSRHELRTRVAGLTGEHRYVVDQALKSIMSRCRELNMRMARSEHESLLGAAILLTVQTIGLLRGRSPKFQR